MKITTGTIMPAFQYADALAAIEWFCKVLGFEKKLVVPGPDDTVIHAQLSYGTGMIMLSSDNDTEYGQHMTSPDNVGGLNTQSCLIYVSDEAIKAHYDQAVANGGEVLVSLRHEEYGGRYYSLKDPEGHLWSIGSYDPYAEVNHG